MRWRLTVGTRGPATITIKYAGETFTIETDAEGWFEAPSVPFPWAAIAHKEQKPWWRRWINGIR